MLKYMAENYLGTYEWFMMHDDDAYMNLNNLLPLLRSIDSSQPVYMGNPGYGRDLRDKISTDMNFCQGGPGVIFSKEALRQLHPMLDYCLYHNKTVHDDLEIGRCMNRLGIKCTEAWEVTDIFWQNYKKKDEIGIDGIGYHENVKKENLNSEIIRQARTFHAIKEPKYMYGLHVEVLKSDIERLQHKQIELLKEIKFMENLVDGHVNLQNSDTNEFSSPDLIDNLRFFAKVMEHTGKTRQAENIHIWTEILNPHNKVKGWERHHRYYWDDQVNRDLVEPHQSVVTKHLDQAIASIWTEEERFEDNIIDIKVPAIYYTTSNFGAHYAADMIKIDKNWKKDVARVHMVQKYRQFSFVEDIEFDVEFVKKIRRSMYYKENKSFSLSESKHIHFIVPFSGRPGNFVRFMGYYEKILELGYNMHLVVVLFIEESDDPAIDFIRKEFRKLQTMFPKNEFTLIKVSKKEQIKLRIIKKPQVWLQVCVSYYCQNLQNFQFLCVYVNYAIVVMLRLRLDTKE